MSREMAQQWMAQHIVADMLPDRCQVMAETRTLKSERRPAVPQGALVAYM